MGKSVVRCIQDFTEQLDKNGYIAKEITIELPYYLRLRLQEEMLSQMRQYDQDMSRGRIPEFTLNTQLCPVLITSLKSEREQALRLRLVELDKRRVELDKQEEELNEILKGIK